MGVGFLPVHLLSPGRNRRRRPPLVQPEYLSLEQLCQDYAVELLGMCRNQSEVTTILNSCGDESQDSFEGQAFEEGIPSLSRLRLAVNYNQKQVAPGEIAVRTVEKPLLSSCTFLHMCALFGL